MEKPSFSVNNLVNNFGIIRGSTNSQKTISLNNKLRWLTDTFSERINELNLNPEENFQNPDENNENWKKNIVNW